MDELRLFSKDQLAEFQEVFQLFDDKRNNTISVSNAGEALRYLGLNPKESDLKKFLNLFQPNERISFESFVSVYRAVSDVKVNETTDDFVDCLRHFDKDGNGFISSAELRHLLTTLGEKFTDEEVETLLAGQKDLQGNVSYEEFVYTVMSG